MLVILFSKIWAAALSIVLVPVYIKFIGVESYGLVAFYATLAGALAILDVGLSASVIRQVAVYKTEQNKEQNLNNLIFTIEIINWVIAIIVGLCIVFLATPISTNWVKAKQVDMTTIKQCVMLMGAVFAFQFPTSVYDGAMVGLQKQTDNAIINIFFTTLKAVGVIVVLYFIKPSVQLYFIWQAVITLINAVVLRWYVYKKISGKLFKATFSNLELEQIWKFAAGIAGTVIVTFFITQIDKIIVSQNLEQLTYYSLGFLLASGITAIIAPMQSIIYPKLTQYNTLKDSDELLHFYHQSCRWVSIVIFPLGLIVIAFANDILLLWTKNEMIAANTTNILKVVVAGTLCNSMMVVPYYLTLAKGNTKYGLYQNIILAIVMLPLLFWWYNSYGALGASFVWLAVNAAVVLISIPIFHKLYLRGEWFNWLKNDIAFPLIVAATLVLATKYLQIYFIPSLSIISLGLLIFMILILYALIIPETKLFLSKNLVFLSSKLKNERKV